MSNTILNAGTAISSSISSGAKRTRASLSPTNTQQPTSRPRIAPCVVEDPINGTERWEHLNTLKPTQPQKLNVPKSLKCVSCQGVLEVKQNAHKLTYTHCEDDDVILIPCSTTNCKGWLPPTLRNGARRTCKSCHHIYYRCECRRLHVVPATNIRYKCENCAEQVCHYQCREQ